MNMNHSYETEAEAVRRGKIAEAGASACEKFFASQDASRRARASVITVNTVATRPIDTTDWDAQLL